MQLMIEFEMVIFWIILIMNLFTIGLLLTMAMVGLAGIGDLKQQIQNTQQLIQLYQQKLSILKDLYERNYPEQYIRNKGRTERKILHAKDRPSPHLVLINQFAYTSLFFQDKYLLSNNQIVSLNSQQAVAEYMGDVLIVEPTLITTLIGGKINLVEFKEEGGSIKKDEYLLGVNGEKLESIWHRNYNIKDGEDLLIQWFQNRILFKGKQVNTITLPSEERVISIYSLNQYKVIFVSTHRIGIINSRSLQIGECENAQNITKIKKNTTMQTRISQSYRQDNFVIVLLSTGELGKYYNEKIVNVQMVPGISQQFDLAEHSLVLQYVHPYLFIANKNTSAIKVYQNQANRFIQIFYANVEPNSSVFAFFKQNDSYRVGIVSANSTKIYEMMLPSVEEAASGTNYFKFMGIIAVVVCFIYFKWVRKGNDEQGQLLQRKELLRKQQQFEKIRNQMQDLPDISKQKNRYAQSQAEEFLRKEPRENHKKIN